MRSARDVVLGVVRGGERQRGIRSVKHPPLCALLHTHTHTLNLNSKCVKCCVNLEKILHTVCVCVCGEECLTCPKCPSPEQL